MHLCIPRKLMGMSGWRDVDFKWTDNISDDDPDIMTFISDGDVAPNGRFNYRYLGSSASTAVDNLETDHIADGVNVSVAGPDVVISNEFDITVEVSVYDMVGRCHYSGNLRPDERVRIPLSHGVFVARYVAEAIVGAAKFVK